MVRKEIDYFTKFELTRHGSSRKAQARIVDMASCSSSHVRPSFWFLVTSWKKKKRRGCNGFLPSICSAIEVTDSSGINAIPGFNYRILKSDENNSNM